jgi:phage terminase large subunit GpA-like protein
MNGKTHTHVYCPECKCIQKLVFDDVLGYDPAGRFTDACDIVCPSCKGLIATFFKELLDAADVSKAQETETKAKELLETFRQKDRVTINIQRTRQEPN